MKKFMFFVVAALAMVSCSGNGCPAECTNDTVAVDTMVVDSAVVDTTVVDSVAVDTVK